MSDGNFLWYWGYGEEPDGFIGPEDTRDAALSAARAEANDGAFTIIEADKQTPTPNIFDVGEVLEAYEEANVDCWNEDGPDISVSREKEIELEQALAKVLNEWMDKHDAHGFGWAFGRIRNKEFFPAVKADPLSPGATTP